MDCSAEVHVVEELSLLELSPLENTEGVVVLSLPVDGDDTNGGACIRDGPTTLVGKEGRISKRLSKTAGVVTDSVPCIDGRSARVAASGLLKKRIIPWDNSRVGEYSRSRLLEVSVSSFVGSFSSEDSSSDSVSL